MAAALRAQFPVLERLAYLNAGTSGPVPRTAVEAAGRSIAEQAERGRGSATAFEDLFVALAALRRRAAGLLGAREDEVALTGSTTDGVNAVLSALDLSPGDEVLTSDEEHPGVLAPLAAVRQRRGVEVRLVPFDALPAAIGPRTRLVVCSHVSWVSGKLVDAAALAGAGAPVLLDGAQGLGAVPVDVRELGCDFYAASGQKWLCGPNGIGYLYARADAAGRLPPAWPGYGTVMDPVRALDGDWQPDARRFDTGLPAPHTAAWAVAGFDLLDDHGWPHLHRRAAELAERLARSLSEAGRTVAPRGRSTLVSWHSEDPEAETDRLLRHGVVVRHIPGRPYVRASVGAWTSEEELDRLIAASA